MPYSHHSHSGQFCPGHARNTLEEMIQAAIAKKMSIFALTEHMPRDELDFYAEEIESQTTAQSLVELIDEFYPHAVQLREKYADRIKILVGFESEWIRPSSLALIKALTEKFDFDFFVGSVHHLFTIPIDYDQEKYDEVKKLVGGTDEEVFSEYFDAQYSMLRKLKPAVVGHLDLIRLYSDDSNGSFRQYEHVWEKITRNLRFIASYGGLVELNSSAIRKGMDEPYPKVEICEAFVAMDGKFTLSDDSHGIEQVGFGYHSVLEAIRRAGIQEIHFLERKPLDDRINGDTGSKVSVSHMPVSDLEQHPFWSVDLDTSPGASQTEAA